jgi:hypothetical protein
VSDEPNLEAPTQEYVVFTRQAYEDAITYLAGCGFHNGFIMRRELGDPIPLVHVGFYSNDLGFEDKKHGITGTDNSGDFAFVLGDPIPWRELNDDTR